MKKLHKQLSISKQKSFVYWLNFPEGFGYSDVEFVSFNLLPGFV